MQTLDIDRPGMPDLQFVLLVAALCTSRLPQCNVSEALRATIFERCWMLIHEGPPPTKAVERVLDLRAWTEITLDAMLETIRSVLRSAGIRTLAWEHPRGETIHRCTAAIQPLAPTTLPSAHRCGADEKSRHTLTGHHHPFVMRPEETLQWTTKTVTSGS